MNSRVIYLLFRNETESSELLLWSAWLTHDSDLHIDQRKTPLATPDLNMFIITVVAFTDYQVCSLVNQALCDLAEKASRKRNIITKVYFPMRTSIVTD